MGQGERRTRRHALTRPVGRGDHLEHVDISVEARQQPLGRSGKHLLCVVGAAISPIDVAHFEIRAWREHVNRSLPGGARVGSLAVGRVISSDGSLMSTP